jgi:hypothetical protein
MRVSAHAPAFVDDRICSCWICSVDDGLCGGDRLESRDQRPVSVRPKESHRNSGRETWRFSRNRGGSRGATTVARADEWDCAKRWRPSGVEALKASRGLAGTSVAAMPFAMGSGENVSQRVVARDLVAGVGSTAQPGHPDGEDVLFHQIPCGYSQPGVGLCGGRCRQFGVVSFVGVIRKDTVRLRAWSGNGFCVWSALVRVNAVRGRPPLSAK